MHVTIRLTLHVQNFKPFSVGHPSLHHLTIRLRRSRAYIWRLCSFVGSGRISISSVVKPNAMIGLRIIENNHYADMVMLAVLVCVCRLSL